MELVEERDRLVAALRERGVDYMSPEDAEGEPVPEEALIASLAANEDPRLRQALIALLLLHPHLAPAVQRVRPNLDPPAETELVAHYMAAVYLQRMWHVRLGHYLPRDSNLPDYFSQELGLPSPEAGYGKPGLYALADWHAVDSPHRANHLSEYLGVAELLFERLKLKVRRHVPAIAS